MKRTPLRPRSKTSSRAKLQSTYLRRKKQYLEDNTSCEICHCNPKFTLDLHHKAGRHGSSINNEGDLERNLVNTKTFMALCRPCHDHVHKYPQQARENGWLV